MKKIAELILPDDRLYTIEHIWAKKDGDSFLLGISDFAQDQLGEIVYTELPSIKESFVVNNNFGTIESVKSVNNLYMPFDGFIHEINTSLENTPTIVNVDPYANWIVRVQARNEADFEKLLSANDYKAFLAK